MSIAPPADRAPSDRLQAAVAQLEASRSALRQHLIPAPDPDLDPEASPRLAFPLLRVWRRLRRLTRQSPAVALLTEAAQGWWLHHPWRPTGQLLLGQVRPLVRRHPAATAATAALVGAALVGLRPWRWPSVDRRLRPLPGQLSHWLLAQLRSGPMQLALASLLLMPDRDDEPSKPEQAPDTADSAIPPGSPDKHHAPLPL